MKKTIGIILLTLVLIQFTVVNVYGENRDLPRRRIRDLSPEDIQELENSIHSYIMGKTVISVINSLLMAYIMWFYYMMYRENGSKFSLGLIALSASLLVYSLTSNPWLLFTFSHNGYMYTGLFNFVPDLFTTATAVIMIYLIRT